MDIFQMSLSGAVLIIAVMIVRALALHRLPKKMFLALWGIVICRLLIPFSIPSRFSFYTGINMIKHMLAGKTDVSSPTEMVSIQNIINIPAAGESIGVGSSTLSLSPIEVIWLAGLCACALFFIVTYIKCCREFKMSLPIENDLITLWQLEHPLRRPVQIRQSDRIESPLTYGIFRPVVLLPQKTDLTDEARLQYILTHEYVHIRRFDTLIKLVLTSSLCVHWFNPFVWVMYVLANRDIELSCDETVVMTFGKTMKSAYAMMLIDLEEKKNGFTPLCNNFSKNAIEERVVSVMKIKKTSLAGMLLALAVVIGITTVFATNASAVGQNVESTGNQPVQYNTETGPKEMPNTENISNNDWVWPVKGYSSITETFGKRNDPAHGHNVVNSDHICIGADGIKGADVYAALAGTVSETSFDIEQGKYIVINHDNGIKTIYRHLGKLLASAGDTVAAGDTIATVGSTGKVTGPCLSFCVYVDGTATNPLNYFK